MFTPQMLSPARRPTAEWIRQSVRGIPRPVASTYGSSELAGSEKLRRLPCTTHHHCDWQSINANSRSHWPSSSDNILRGQALLLPHVPMRYQDLFCYAGLCHFEASMKAALFLCHLVSSRIQLLHIAPVSTGPHKRRESAQRAVKAHLQPQALPLARHLESSLLQSRPAARIRPKGLHMCVVVILVTGALAVAQPAKCQAIAFF